MCEWIARFIEKREKVMKIDFGGKRRILGTLILVLGVGILGAYYYLQGRAKAEDYITAKIERGAIRKTINATGTLQAVKTVQVGSQVSGTISALYVDFNSVVRKGQVVAQLDPAIFQAQVAQQRANRENAHANLADAKARLLAAESTVMTQRAGVSSSVANLAAFKAQRDDAAKLLERQESLARSGIVADRDLESVRANYVAAQARYEQASAQLEQARANEQSAAKAGLEAAKAQVQQAQAQVKQSEAAVKLAEVNLSHTTIASPIDGVIVSRNVDVGQTVAASLSAPTLFTIANDLTQMWVIANVDQADIGVISSANRVSFSVDAFPGINFKGTINQIRLSPQEIQNVVTYNVVIDVKNEELKLKPGMTANLTFTIDERNDVLKLPNSALRFRPSDITQEQIREMLRNSASGSAPGTTGQRKRPEAEQTPGSPAGENTQRRGGFAASTAAVLAGQKRVVWVQGPDKKPQPRVIEIGITDGVSVEIAQGNLKEGDLVIVGQNVTTGNGTQNRQTTTPPGFGGAPGGGPGGGRPR